MTNLAAKLRSRDALREVLLTAAAERDRRPDLVTTEYGTECERVGYERHRMLDSVNGQLADRRGTLTPETSATEQAIARVEGEACGHIDYVDKYALYCAEIVLGVRDPQTGEIRRG